MPTESEPAVYVAQKRAANAENTTHDVSGDTIVDRLLRRPSEPVDRVALRWLRDDGSEEAVWTCTQLTAKMLLVSHHLEHVWSATVGDRALLVYSPGLHFVAAFLGCLCMRALLPCPSIHQTRATQSRG